jgi:hypothetical protein
VVECLSSKCKALSLNPILPKTTTNPQTNQSLQTNKQERQLPIQNHFKKKENELGSKEERVMMKNEMKPGNNISS